MKLAPKEFLLVVMLSLAGHCSAIGATISWNSSFDSILIDSAGNALDHSFSFEMGTFGSFVPTSENMSDWGSNWKVFDKAYLDDANGWNWEDRFFTRSVVHNSDGTSSSPFANPPFTLSPHVFAENEVVYLWVYNSKDHVSGSEWALVTDGLGGLNSYDRWLMPDPSESSSISYEWHLDDAGEVILGGANNVQGDGSFTANLSTFNLQTSAVPEPTSALLLLGALAWLGWQSQRRRATPCAVI